MIKDLQITHNHVIIPVYPLLLKSSVMYNYLLAPMVTMVILVFAISERRYGSFNNLFTSVQYYISSCVQPSVLSSAYIWLSLLLWLFLIVHYSMVNGPTVQEKRHVYNQVLAWMFQTEYLLFYSARVSWSICV